jgi:parallel beta-helix repeat protein
MRSLAGLLLVVCAVPVLPAQTVVNPGDNLQNVVSAAAAGATLLLNPGTYSLPGTLVVTKALTIRNNQATRPLLQVPGGTITTIQLSASNVTFEGINVAGGYWGIYAGDPGGIALSNIVIRDANVDTNPSAATPGHGIYVRNIANAILERVTVVDAQVNGILVNEGSVNATITGCTVMTTLGPDAAIKIDNSTGAYLAGNTIGNTGAGAHGILLWAALNATVTENTISNAYANGILADNNSDNSAIINNTVLATVTQHAIAVKNSSGVTVAGNKITGSGFHGILLIGAPNGRVNRNSISGIRHDGITLDKESGSGRFSSGNYIGNNTIVSTSRQSGETAGTGIWLNSESNGTLVYANSTTGAPENGLSVFNASYNHFLGNVTSDNAHGGVFIYGPMGLSYSVGPPPSYTVVQGTFAFNLPANGGVHLNRSSANTAFSNFVQSAPVGTLFQTTSNNQVFLNSSYATTTGIYAYGDTGTTSFFLNRTLTQANNNVSTPASVTLDGGPVFGGNYWTGHSGGPYSIGAYQDRYAYGTSTLGKQPYVNVLYPTAGTFASIGSQKTIEWRSAGCSFVDISYQAAATGLVSIAANYPDVGLYRWTVPNVPVAGDYTIYIECKNGANQSLGVNGRSDAFTVAAAGIELLTPQGNERLTAGSQALVAWKRTGVGPGVDVLYRSGTGVFSTVLASNVTRDTVFVTVPATATSRGSFLVRASSNNSIADSTDGFVTIRSSSSQVIAPSGTLQVGTLQQVEWTSPSTSQYVDIEYWDTTANVFRPVIQNLPDFGRYTFLVPDKVMTGSFLRVGFKTTPAGAASTANSGNFNIANDSSGGGAPGAAPTAVSVSPASGSGASTTFAAVYNDGNGAADLSLVYLLVNSSINGAGACFAEYNRAANTYRLINDAGNTWSAAIGVGQSTANSQCTLSPSGTTGTPSGNSLTVNFPLTFSAAFAGGKNTYLLATDNGGGNSTWQQKGTWTIPANTPGPGTGQPAVVSMSPLEGSATEGTFTATYSHSSGRNEIYLGYMLFLPTPNVVNYVATGSCLVEYNRISNGMRLIDDAGTGWLGPLTGVPAGAGGGTLSNSYCTLDTTQSGATFSGNSMILSVKVTFKPVFTGVLGTFLQQLDVNGVWTGMTQFGNWVVYPLTTPKPGPYITSAQPASGAGAATTYSITTGHTGGVQRLSMVNLLISTQIVGGGPCHVVFFPAQNQVYLINDAGTALVPGSITPNTNTGAISNSRCTVSGAGLTRSSVGNELIVNLPVSFNVGAFGGPKTAYANTFDDNGFLTHWQQIGTWSVQ